MDESCHNHIWMRHLTYESVMPYSHMHQSCHNPISMNHVITAYECVVSLTNQSCHIPIRMTYVFVAWLAAQEIKTFWTHIYTHIHDENTTHAIYQRDFFKPIRHVTYWWVISCSHVHETRHIPIWMCHVLASWRDVQEMECNLDDFLCSLSAGYSQINAWCFI